MKTGKDLEKNFRDVKFYDNKLYYKVNHKKCETILSEDRFNIKPCIIIDVTKEVQYTVEEFIGYCDDELNITCIVQIVEEVLAELKYKVFKEISLNLSL